MYKEAILSQLRIPTSKGELSVEQVATLNIDELDKLAVKLSEAYDNSKAKSFLTTRSVKDKKIKLMMDIVIDLLYTKKDALDAATQAKEDKEYNDTILALISEKQQDELKGKSITELKKMLKKTKS